MANKPGDIVAIRHRLWRVDSLGGDILSATCIDGDSAESHRFFIPCEKIDKGQIQPPHPEKIGDVATNRLLVQAFQYSMIHGTAPLMSLRTSAVIPTEYQLAPVIMALNQGARVRMLIADDLGLGKTIEAGLIASELKSRKLAQRILIICPQNLREQWQDALRYFFRIDAKILSSVHLRGLEKNIPPGMNPWEYYPNIITSIDYIKSERIRPFALSADWNLVIIDEAQYVAKPHQNIEKDSVSMLRYNLAQEIAKNPKIHHLLLLSATPHNGYTDTFASLLAMLDCGIVSGPVHEPVINRTVAKDHVCQRRRKDVVDWFRAHAADKNPFPTRDQKMVPVDLEFPEEREFLNELDNYGSGLLDLARKDNRIEIRTMARWVVLHLHRRALSSPHALRISLANRLRRIEEKIHDQDERPEQSISVAQAKAVALDGEGGEDLSDEEAVARVDRVTYGTLSALEAEARHLRTLIEHARSVTATKDSKIRELTKKDGYLDSSMRGRYGPRKALIFTRYKDTLDYLVREIPKRLKTLDSSHVFAVYGDLNEKQRHEVMDAFIEADHGVLVATDCISEGVNLQHMANQVIHYELPWNPNRLEQRNGRIDRYGQPEREVHIRTIVMRDTLDTKILLVLYEKAQKIRDEYGFSPPFFGDDADVITLIGDMGLKIDLPSSQRTLFDSFMGESTPEPRIDPFSKETIEKIKSESFYGQTAIDLAEVQTRIALSERIIGTREDFQNFVKHGLERYGCTITENHDRNRTLRLMLSDELVIPQVPQVIEKATFDERIALQETGIDQLNTAHPVVRRLIELIKRDVFSPNTEFYGRTCVVATPDVAHVTALYHFLVRYTVGGVRPCIVEEIVPVACDLVTGTYPTVEDTAILERVQKVSLPPGREGSVKNHLVRALAEETWSSVFMNRVEVRRKDLVAEREQLKEQLAAVYTDPKWLDGASEVSVASHDLISLRLLEPVPAGVQK
jgi:superfamily II DNA or RNA helicase